MGHASNPEEGGREGAKLGRIRAIYVHKLFIIQAGVDMCYGFRDELSNNSASAIRESFSKI